MAHLLIAKDYMPPDPLAVWLREELSDDLIVVVGAQVFGTTIDAVVLTEQGLLVLLLVGSTQAPQDVHPETADRALVRFLADEFPGLQPEIQHLVLRLEGGEPPTNVDAGWGRAAPDADVIPAIAATVWTEQAHPLDWKTRCTLAAALQERRLTSSQRASAPFVFRSGGWLHRGREAWTIRHVIDRMDHSLEDGIFHLRNGTLIRWFEEQGAAHLARLARAALQEANGDHRAALETFLLGTGLVERPSLVIQPPSLDLGRVVSGETACARLTIRRGRGRGYLVGAVKSAQQWVTIEPDRLAAGNLDALIRVDTAGLQIQAQPHIVNLSVNTNARTAAVTVPVRVRVTANPSPFWQHVLRPALTGAIAGVVGGVLGWWLGSLIPGITRWPLGPLLCAAAAGLGFAASSVAVRSHMHRRATTRNAGAKASLPPLEQTPPGRRVAGRWLEGFVALGLIVVALLVLLRPATLDDEIATAEVWMTRQLDHVEAGVDRLTDAWMLRRYDRRAPSAVPLAAPQP